MPAGIKIASLFLTILVSSLISGFNKIRPSSGSLFFYESPWPDLQHPSVIDYYLYPGPDSGLKIRFLPQGRDRNPENAVPRISRFAEICRKQQARILSFLQSPERIEILLTPPVIIFPFNYFW
jgi:hypothetical protein